MLKNYGFIAMAPGFEPDQHNAVLESPAFKMTVIGVETVEEAGRVAQRLVAAGVELIELCGAFDAETARAVRQAIQDAVPVDYVQPYAED